MLVVQVMGVIELNMNLRLHMDSIPDKRWQVALYDESCVQSRGSRNIGSQGQEQKAAMVSVNKNGVRILMVGSRQANLQTLALNIFTLCMANQIRLEPEWTLERKTNKLIVLVK